MTLSKIRNLLYINNPLCEEIFKNYNNNNNSNNTIFIIVQLVGCNSLDDFKDS